MGGRLWRSRQSPSGPRSPERDQFAMRLVACILGGVTVLIASFFGTLWLTEPEAAPQRLEEQRISYYSDLPTASHNAGLRYSEQMRWSVDEFSRVNEREVKVGEWAVHQRGDSP